MADQEVFRLALNITFPDKASRDKWVTDFKAFISKQKKTPEKSTLINLEYDSVLMRESKGALGLENMVREVL